MSTLSTIKKGDTVVVERWGNRRSDPRTHVLLPVIAAGPKYITVGDTCKTRFHRDTGYQATEYTSTCRVWGDEAAMYEARRIAGLQARAQSLMSNAYRRHLTPEQCEAIIAILEPSP